MLVVYFVWGVVLTFGCYDFQQGSFDFMKQKIPSFFDGAKKHTEEMGEVVQVAYFRLKSKVP